METTTGAEGVQTRAQRSCEVKEAVRANEVKDAVRDSDPTLCETARRGQRSCARQRGEVKGQRSCARQRPDAVRDSEARSKKLCETARSKVKEAVQDSQVKDAGRCPTRSKTLCETARSKIKEAEPESEVKDQRSCARQPGQRRWAMPNKVKDAVQRQPRSKTLCKDSRGQRRCARQRGQRRCARQPGQRRCARTAEVKEALIIINNIES